MRLPQALLLMLVLSILVLMPLTASAANASFFGPIISPECHCRESAPDWGCVLQTMQNVINVGISLSILVAVVIIAWAGMLFMFSPFHAQSREQGRTMMLNAVIGLAIALSAWLLVDFVMKTLYNENSGFGPWNTILGVGGNRCLEAKAPVTATGIQSGSGASAGGGGGSCPSGVMHQPIQVAPGPEKTIRDRLSGQNVPINKLPCPANVDFQCVTGGCTSIGGWKSATTDQVIELKALCGSIEITGGSEAGHADGGESHSVGAKVDLASGFGSCVTSHPQYFIRDGSRGSHPKYKDKCTPSNEYVNEGSHWDITVRARCQR